MPRSGHTNAPPLSPMTLALLRLSAPQTDMAAWRQFVLSVCAQHPQRILDQRLRELTSDGYITDQGTPRTGWLTEKGRAALRRHES